MKNNECFYQNMLLVAGMSRNTGKTSFILEVIKRFSVLTPLVALKVTNIKPGGGRFHGSHEVEGVERYTIQEETNRYSHKDTSKMLRAGASRAFLVSAREEWLNDALRELFTRVSRESVFVCESGGLRNILKPGVMVIVRSGNEKNRKPGMEKLEKTADLKVFSGNGQFTPGADALELKEGKWFLSPRGREH